VPPELRGDLFKRFFTTKEKGLGLGLAYVRKIAEAHGGSARLEESARGASFVIALPK
jgi:signal transduction histidine kinase